MRNKKKWNISKLRVNDVRAIIVCTAIIISITLTLAVIPGSGVGDGVYNKEVSPRHAVTRNVKGVVHYSQQDIGFGDGSSSAPDMLAENLFPFDPNTADSTTLLRLGLKPWQVRSIYKYRAHGGRYRCREDFAQLYGLTLDQYRRLEPYIRIKKEVMAADVIQRADRRHKIYRDSAATPRQAVAPAVRRYPQKLTLDDPKVDINTADTTLLKRIPGIGSYFARRVVELRGRRNAFASTDELLAIRHFPEEALAYMTVSQNFAIIHINSMTQKELQAHPLLNYIQSRDIVSLRRTSGDIRSVDDLALLRSFTPELLKRIEPFIAFD